MAATGFFNQIPEKQGAEKACINVGGEQFHALAVAFIDALKTSPRLNDSALTKVLQQFFDYFPKFINTQPYMTPPERMLILINSARRAEIVECMAFVLRQITVDELYAHPLKYREAFKDLSAETLKTHLRKTSTVLPASALCALTQALGLTLTLLHIEQTKELRNKVVYEGSSATHTPLSLVLQVHENQYFPQVKDKSAFAYINQLTFPNAMSSEQLRDEPGTLDGLLALIKADNHHILTSYQQLCRTLFAMLERGELPIDRLKTLYIELLPKTDTSFISQAQFFSDLEQQDKKPVALESPVKSTQLLVEALARWVSTGLILEDEFFDRLEKKSVLSF